MSKLKCEEHDRRIQVIFPHDQARGVFVHREDGSGCDSESVLCHGSQRMIGDPKQSPVETPRHQLIAVLRARKVAI